MGLQHRSVGSAEKIFNVILTGGGRYIWHALLLLLAEWVHVGRWQEYRSICYSIIQLSILQSEEFYYKQTPLMEN